MQHTVLEKPLLKSIDGVDLYDLDLCWAVIDIHSGEPVRWKILNNVFDLYKDKGYLFFASREKAEDYIYWNKPIYSRKQLQDGYCNH
jgi:hypothetical protein